MYDAIIIGAGMSGLVCGCYLAKAGLKVLIAEQHNKPGGYCTSFKRKGFTFDAAAHSFGGYKYGNIGKIFEDIEIDKKIKIYRFDPSNIVITPDYKVSFWADINKTIKEFQNIFSDEYSNINNFFHFLIKHDPMSFPHMKTWTFKNLIDQYFSNEKLKAILSFPLFGNAGLPPSQISAFLGIRIFNEFILDGGYYPEGGIQTLSDTFAKKFKEFNGELLLSTLVKKIRIKDNKIAGVVLERDGFISSKYVVSNCDTRQTFLKLLGKKNIDKELLNKINNMIPSPSMFILYLGIDESYNKLPAPGINIWILSHYNLDNVYLLLNNKKWGYTINTEEYLMHLSPDGKSFRALMFAPFKNKNFWNNKKQTLLESFIKKIELDAMPKLSNHIIYKDAATPQTLYSYTLNYKGAAYGWAGTPSQLAINDFRKYRFIKGLYLTGHWTTYGLGIPGVIYVGYDTAKTILKKEKKLYISKLKH